MSLVGVAALLCRVYSQQMKRSFCISYLVTGAVIGVFIYVSLAGTWCPSLSNWKLTEGIVANVLTIILVAAVWWIYHVFSGRHKLMEFFGVASAYRLGILVGNVRRFIPDSSLRVLPEGAVDFEESSAATEIAALFRTVIPGLADQAGWLRWLQLADIEVKVEPSPENPGAVRLDCPTISLGSPMSNSASEFMETNLASPVKFVKESNDEWRIEIPGIPPIHSPNHGFIVRFFSGGSCYFYIAGRTGWATSAAARYLATNWRSLHRQYPKQEHFYVLVETSDGSSRILKNVASARL